MDLEDLAFTTFIRNTNLGDNFFTNINNFCNESMHDKDIPDFKNLQLCLHVASKMQDEGLIQKCAFEAIQKSCLKIISEICDSYIINVLENFHNSVDILKCIQQIIELCCKICGNEIEHSICSLLPNLFKILDADDHSRENQMAVLNIISCILQYTPANILTKKSDIWEKLFSQSMLSRKFVNVTLISKILPIMVTKLDYHSEAFILTYVWDYIRSKPLTVEKDCSCNDMQDTFVMLNTLVDISLNTQYLQQKYISEVFFWEILFRGFVHNNSVVRKQVQCIFKKILSWAKNSLTCIKLPSHLYTYFIYDSTSLVIKDSMAVWDDLLSCFEVLEQKQLHIIKPHLPKVLHLLQLSKHSGNNMSETAFFLNTSWVMTLLQRMWKHDAKYIRHWSAVCVVNQQDPCIFLNYDENFTYLFFEAFFKVLNDPSIYARPEYDATESLYITHKDIGNFLSVCCNSFPTIVKTGHFLQLVLNILSNSSYSSVPLLYIVKAISQMPSCQAWKRTDVPNILHLLRRALQTQDLLLQRSVIHNLLKSAIELLDMKDLHYCDLCLFLNAFFDCNALIPKSLLWTKLVGSLRKHLSCENSLLDVNILRELCYKDRTSLLNSVQENHTNFDLTGPGMYLESVKHITQTWAVLVEAKVFCSESCEIKNMHHCLSFPTFASPFFKLVETTVAQPLVLSTVTRNILTVHFYLVEEILQQNSCFDYECRKALEFMGKILYRVTEEICVLHNIEDLEWICFALRILDALLKNRNNNPNENLILMILKQYVNQLEKDFQAINQVQFWCFIGKIALCAEKKSIASEYISTIMQKVIGNTCLTLSFKKPRFVKCETSKNLWLNCVENATISICHCLQLYIAFHIDDLSELNILSIYQQVLDILKEENKVHIPLLLKCIELILLKIENSNFVCEALAVSWNCLKTWGFYRPALKAFISMCFQPHLLKKDLPLLMQYVKKLKTLEDRPACLSMLYIHICQVFKVDENRANCFEYISFLSYGLLYGPMRRKDQRVVTEAIESIMDEELVDEKLSLMCMKADFHIRLEVIHVVLTTIEAGSAEKFICLFIEDLLLKQEEITQNKPSYFLNSYQHRVQNRVWQSILLLNELLALNLSRKKLLLKILKNSFTQNSQISVKYFQDWTVLRIVYFHTELLSEIFAVTQECFNQPPSYQVRLLSILIHLIELNVINSPDSALQWMPLILKFCVAHNFEIRLYAALALQSMWKYCSKHSYFHVLEKFDFVQGSELTNPKSGNFPRNIDNLRQGYYFSSFHPMKSFSFQTIFVDLLFYSNVTMQEWIQPSHFLEKHKMHPFPDCFKIFNQNDVSEVLPGSYMFKAQSQISSSKNTFINCNFQRKFVPQKVCDKFLAVDCNNTETSESQSCKELDLIVVASLVEKLPNLGGLCRSCEALGVSEFIVKDFKSTEHKMFQSLSVTAEKWITISEVKVHQLKKYLVRMKSKNYSIIGCEQTEKSQKITEFTFPMKSLILLGHEKEGIPVEFLEYLDVSIEIPQSGVIRSLNVHVAGALLIYEFFRQHKRI